MNVEVVLRKVIKPSNPTPKHLLYHPLSLLDHVNSRVLMPSIFFYSPTNNHNNNNPIATTEMFVTRLSQSLAVTLTVFYPLAGRIEDGPNPNHYVVCNDEGVPYVEAQIRNCRLNDVVNKIETKELDKLLPLKPKGLSELLLAVQVTVFGCGGVSIGLCINHKLSDAFSLLMFVNTWASVARGGDPFLLPFFGAATLFPIPTRTPTLQTQPQSFQLKQTEKELVTKRFVFSYQTLNALKPRYKNRNFISSGLALLAFISTQMASHKPHVKHVVFQPVNVRPLINPLPPTHYYFGNLFINAIAKEDEEDKEEDPFGNFTSFVDSMRDAMMKINAEFVERVGRHEQSLNFVTDHFERDQRGEIVSLGFTNYCRLPVYESDFGWGKPVWVASASLAMKNLMVFMPSSSGKHIEVYFCLSSEDMDLLENDKEFTSFAINPLSSKL